MKIGELAEKPGIARENIRYYESQNLLHVQRSSNGYRDYSEKDEKELERIIALRKLNVSVKDILSYQEGDLSLK